MNVGIVGLGLIGASFAKDYKADGNWKVYAFDIDKAILGLAKLQGDIDEELTKDNIGECDLIIIALYPQATISYFKENAEFISKEAVVIDCCGTKRMVYKEVMACAKEYGLTYVGGHPMAGRHYSGYKYSKANLFKNASMIIIPEVHDDLEMVMRVKNLLAPAEFARMSVSTPEEHDKIIAYTSQLAHVVSNAYIKSPTAIERKGFSAGSYNDLTRVAWLNEDMWTPLFMENKDNLINELNTIIDYLKEYKDALEKDDADTLKQLLYEGKMRKEELDRR